MVREVRLPSLDGWTTEYHLHKPRARRRYGVLGGKRRISGIVTASYRMMDGGVAFIIISPAHASTQRHAQPCVIPALAYAPHHHSLHIIPPSTTPPLNPHPLAVLIKSIPVVKFKILEK